MKLSSLKIILMIALLTLPLASIHAETNATATNSTTTTSTTSQNIIDQDFINTLITLSPILFFLSICFRFLEFFKEALDWGGGK